MKTQLEIIRDAIGTDRVKYISNHGNAGDAVIAAATAHAFKTLGITLDEDAGTVVVAGGGALTDHYGHLMQAIWKICPTKRVVILPCSIQGNKFAELREVNEQRDPENQLVILCREETTYRECLRWKLKAVRCPDMAFLYEMPDMNPRGGAYRHLYAFRTDGESVSAAVPENNVDLSLKYGQKNWELDSDSEQVAQFFCMHFDNFDEITTDRTHVAIIGARQGIAVNFHPNSYHKNEGIFLASLSAYRVNFVSPFRQIE